MNALEGEAGRKYAEKVQKRLSEGKPAGPISLGEEKECNPYLKIDKLQDFCRLFN